jgi:hypothetical protein
LESEIKIGGKGKKRKGIMEHTYLLLKENRDPINENGNEFRA